MAEQLPRGLLADPAMQRAMLLPVARRTYTDPGDDITEELGGLEFAAPGLLYDPMLGMAQTGAMLMGDMPVDPNVMTQTMLDAPLVSGLLSAATGAVPEGAVLGAFSGRGVSGMNDLPQYRTSDGYTFYQQKDGTLTDNADPEMSDMVFNSLDDLANDFGEMPLPVGKNEVAEKAATEFVEDFASFMDPSPDRLPDDVKIQRALNTQRRKKDIDLAANKAPTAALPGLLDDVGKGSGAAHARPLNPTNRSLKGINDSPDDNQPPKENFSAVENIYNLYFYNQNIPPKTAEKIKAVIQKHTATNDINTAERAMLGPALDEIQSLQSAAKSKAKKPRWPSKIDLTTIDGVASALKQKLGGGVISGKPYNSRYFDVGENSRLRISDHLAATRRSANNSGEVIVSYGSKGINFDVGDDSLTIPYNDKRLSNRDGLQELIDLIQGSDSIELGANKSPTAALPGLLQDRRRTPRNQNSFPMRGLLGQRLYTATMPDGSI
tara:strand:+ start:911 stop:2389 length:1479 start_codon:yes stop_codon:yes gene_type:complete